MIRSRTQIYRKFSETDYGFGDINGYKVPKSKKEQNKESENKNGLMLCDLTALKRVGYKGANIDSWCETRYEISCPPINQASMTQQGSLIARLSNIEVLVLEDIDNNSDATIVQESTSEIYALPRQDSHHCFMLIGQTCATMFSKLCAVDLRTHKFQNMHVAQTTLACVSAIIIRRDIKGNPGYLVMVDSSFAEYIWDCLLDAMLEFGGTIIGQDEISNIITIR